MEKALEFFHFDFEFADEPADTSLMQNADVFEVDPKFPDMFITDPRGYSQVKSSRKTPKISDYYKLCFIGCFNLEAQSLQQNRTFVSKNCQTIWLISYQSNSDNWGHSVKNTFGGRAQSSSQHCCNRGHECNY